VVPVVVATAEHQLAVQDQPIQAAVAAVLLILAALLALAVLVLSSFAPSLVDQQRV